MHFWYGGCHGNSNNFASEEDARGCAWDPNWASETRRMSCLCSTVDVASLPHVSTTALVVRPTCTRLTSWTPVPCSRAVPLPGKFLQLALDRSTPLPGPSPSPASSLLLFALQCPAEEPREEPQAMHRDLHRRVNAYAFTCTNSEHCFTNRVLHMYTRIQN